MAIGAAGLHNTSAGLGAAFLGGAGLQRNFIASEFDPDLTLYYNFVTSPSLNAIADSITGDSLGPTLGLTRTGNRSITDWEGLIREVADGEPGFTGGRYVRNRVTQSSDVAVSPWSATNMSVTSGQADPDGGTSAFLLTDDSTDAVHHIFQSNVADNTIPDTTTSIWVKAGTARYVTFAVRTPNAVNTQWNNIFDATAGTFVLSTTAFGIPYGVEDKGAGWYRISLDSNIGNGAYDNFYIGIADGPLITDISYIGAATDILIWHPQVESVSGQATKTPSEYQATTTAPASSWYATKKDGTALATAITGLLVEEARTNIQIRSEALDDAAWSKGSSVVAANSTTAPDGTTTADKLTDNNNATSGAATILDAVTHSTSTAHTISFFAKKDQTDWIAIKMLGQGALVIEAYYDLTNGVIGATTGTDNTSEFIEDYGNGWYRCGLTYTSDAVDTTGNFTVYLADGDNDILIVRLGDHSVFLWGAQAEAGAFPSTYIPTVASSVTRNFDNISSTDLSWFAQNDPCTVYVVMRSEFNSGESWAFSISNGISKLINVGVYAGGTAAGLEVKGAGAFGLSTRSGMFPSSASVRLAGGVAEDNLRIWADGASGSLDTTADIPAAAVTVRVGGEGVASTSLNGHVGEVRYYNVLKDQTFVEALSNGTQGPEL